MKNKFVINNWEKIILFVLIAISAKVIISHRDGLYMQGEGIDNKFLNDEFIKPPSQIEGLETYENTLKMVKEHKQISDYDNDFERNIFTKYEKPVPPLPLFEFESAEKKYIDISYNGFIESNVGIVGQVKIGKRTYFVKEGEKIADYKIIKLQRGYLIIKDIQGKEIKLPLRIQILSDEYKAILYIPQNDEKIEVGKGDLLEIKKDGFVEKFKILDISGNYVVLLNEGTNEELVVSGSEERLDVD